MKIKNIAIIAHVDHGKTTLLDAILKQTGVFRDNQKVEERVMDSNDLEKEKGITIFSKVASFYYNDYKVNIVDTPGHADFGGEVQRIMKMVDSVLLLVDAGEGPMPQTKYVLKKSLELELNPIVVINKIDRPNIDIDKIVEKIFDLFIELNANDNQLDFPIVYTSAKNEYALYEKTDAKKDMKPLFETIIKNVKDTEGNENEPFQFLTSATEYDNYVGKIGTGKIFNGKVKLGDEVILMKRDGERLLYRITKIITYKGLKRIDIKEAFAGDIVSLAGLEMIDVGETVACRNSPKPLPLIDIDEPTLIMSFSVNNSPFAGNEGKYITSKRLLERLKKEANSNVSIKLELTDSSDTFILKGRGELQLAIIIENIRRDNFEFQVSKPKVIFRELHGKKTEPFELALIDVADEFVGAVIEMMGVRKGEMIDMVQGNDGYTRLEFKIPERGLIGFLNEFLTTTRGTGVLNHSFYEYEYYKGDIPGRKRGVLVAHKAGVSTAYAIHSLQDRGKFFIDRGVNVYAGMVVGENNKDSDLVVNVCKKKKLTNVRSSGSDDAVKLTPHIKLSLEQALAYIENDELLEVTPKSLRIRKKILNIHERKKNKGV